MIRFALAALAALTFAVPAVAAGLRDNPEYKRLPPTANPGYFLGYPVHTYSWHGCTATATKAGPFARVPGAPPLPRGTRQRTVSFTVTTTAPYISWKVKDGWTICGVQASAQLHNDDVSSDLLAEIGYTSQRKRGSTAPGDGKETIRVPIRRKAIDRAEFEKYEGKTFTIAKIHDVTVFVKRVR